MQEQLEWLIDALLAEMPRYRAEAAGFGPENRFALFRALVNLRPPMEASEAFLRRQDAYLRRCIAQKGVTVGEALPFCADGTALWRGDIATLQCDGIVNAANSRLLGCFCPNHGCIDNVIHTYAGVQLRLACARLMAAQGREEETGRAKLTPAFNLPSKYVLHTVGPIIAGNVSREERELLASCYRSCLDLAAENGLRSVAFCCVSTGEFRFPNELAARVALDAARSHPAVQKGDIKVIFDVFTEKDEQIYRRLQPAFQSATIGAEQKAVLRKE